MNGFYDITNGFYDITNRYLHVLQDGPHNPPYCLCTPHTHCTDSFLWWELEVSIPRHFPKMKQRSQQQHYGGHPIPMTYLSCNWLLIPFDICTQHHFLVKSHEHKRSAYCRCCFGRSESQSMKLPAQRRHSFHFGIVACIFSFHTAEWKLGICFLFVLFISNF